MRIHSPGRINIIGEHTDYTGGWVMPASIHKGITFDVERFEGTALQLLARDLEERATLRLPVSGRTGKIWVDYLAGIVEQFQQLGFEVPGLKIDFGGDIPRGSGLSSSAALEGGMAFLLNEIVGAGLTRPELAQLCQRSSNNFLGIPSGIMDQFASLNGTEEGPILLNCDTLEFTPVKADLPGYRWILVNSMVTHEHSNGEYHVRVRECAEALATLREEYPGLDNLSAATEAQLQTVINQLPENVAARARYVVAENERVHQMAAALATGDAGRVGELLNETNRGLRDEYEVSCEEVDFLQALLTGALGAVGGRIMGGGFGGCVLCLVGEGSLENLRSEVADRYKKKYGISAEIYDVRIGNGTRILAA